MGLQCVEAILVPETATAVYTCPASTVTTRLHLTFISADTVNNAVRVWIVPSGGSVGDDNRVVSMTGPAAMIPGETRHYHWNQVLEAGDAVYVAADDLDEPDHQVVCKVDVNELPAAGFEFDGQTYRYFVGDSNTDYLPNSLTEEWEVPTDPSVQVVQAELLVHNAGSSNQAFTLSLVPSGETPGDLDWLAISGTLQWSLKPGESRTVPLDHFSTPGYEYHWRALNATEVVGRLSLECIEL